MANPEVTRIINSTEPKPTRVLFARIGWMKYYAGPQAGDERPRGGGAYTKKNVGHEIFNFADFNGRLYGFVRAKNSRISLERINQTASNADKLADVLVILVARQQIVGWYTHAVVHRTSVSYPAAVVKDVKKRLQQAGTKNFKIEGCCFEGSKDNAVLLPTHERKHGIPGNVKGGFGQSNVCYLYRKSGKQKSQKWMNSALSYVLKYDKENLLKNPSAETDVDEAAVISQEQAAGFQSNIAIRRAVEEFAMTRARDVLKTKGYSSFENTSKFKPYDYTCQKNGKTFFVEVKGTQTSGKTVILTKGEVEHVRKNRNGCILVLVRSVSVSGTKPVRVSGGKVDVLEHWQLEAGDLTAIQYVWTVD